MNPLNILRLYRLARLAKKDEPKPLSDFGYWYLKIVGGLLLLLIAVAIILVTLTTLGLL